LGVVNKLPAALRDALDPEEAFRTRDLAEDFERFGRNLPNQ
jgi:hypothetical protein